MLVRDDIGSAVEIGESQNLVSRILELKINWCWDRNFYTRVSHVGW